MTKVAWVTDSHFNMLKPGKTEKFGKMVATRGYACIITGDIAEGNTVCSYLDEFQRGFGGHVYFVLGNHDIWKSSFSQVHEDVRDLCSENSQLHWLGSGKVHHLGGSQICGVDGWYDYQAGLISERPRFIMHDWHQIEEFKEHFNLFQMGFGSPLTEQFRTLGQFSAIEARATMRSCSKDKPVFFATHMPPFVEASWHKGKSSDSTHLPYYTNIALGYVLMEWAKENEHTQLTTLCGHTHSPGEYRQRDNHIVLTGKSEYGNPQVSKVFDL